VFAARVRPDSGEFASLLDSKETPWVDARCLELARKNLGTLGGGNHFIEIQAGDDGNVWLMIHSGSRNLGYRIASHYHRLSVTLNRQEQRSVPDEELAYLDAESEEGIAYVRDMNFALEYAFENRRRIMTRFKSAIESIVPDTRFEEEINIHHNYAGLEEWNGTSLWIHRKGATSAKKGEYGIIPGSMGTPSYIVRGLGNPDSFQSCSHGAGRAMGRNDACRRLSVKECDRSMEGIVFDRWQLLRDGGKKNRGREKLHDLAEAPLAYKDIETVIESERDLAEPAIRLRPLGVVKG
jgi:tRNA-splicing ligase RtcB